MFNNPGDFLLSHTVTRAVPSAPAGLTSVFGMGTGVTLPTKSPEKLKIQNLTLSDFESVFGLGTLVFVVLRNLNQPAKEVQRPKY